MSPKWCRLVGWKAVGWNGIDGWRRWVGNEDFPDPREWGLHLSSGLVLKQ